MKTKARSSRRSLGAVWRDRVIAGAIRLQDGSVVVVDEQSYEVWMFDAGGRHMWTRGRQGAACG
ncbi:MAG: hypothetical protein OXG58_01315 [Gemmatimonadetes bacterium]|nr:hypothetical protein [Gemmatimonadota bacterium]MCY3943548.1 hypothetical protein [Gemmatimonadota bacterium]